MSAAELRTAAAILRDAARDATPGPWERVEDNHGSHAQPAIESSVWSASAQTYVTEDVSLTESGHTKWSANGDYIATVHPGVGLALADQLDDMALCVDSLNDAAACCVSDDTLDTNLSTYLKTLAIARLINGGA